MPDIRKFIPVIVLAFAVLAILPASAAAQGLFAQLIYQCRADAAELCADVRPGEGRIAACLYSKMDRLRPGCREAVEAGLALKACAWDARRFCGHVTPGEGRIASCLLEFQNNLSPNCQAVLAYRSDLGHEWRYDEEQDLLK